MSVEIKLIDKDTDLSNIRPLSWDVQVNGEPYDVYDIEGYVHTIGGRFNENSYWACPRGEKPTYENLTEFNGHTVNWGFVVTQSNYFSERHDDMEIRSTCKGFISRNGEEFMDVRANSFDYLITEARMLMYKIEEFPIDLWTQDYQQKFIGQKVYWHGQPAIVESYIEGQACVILVPDGKAEFDAPGHYGKDADWMMSEPESVKESIFAPSISWLRQYVEDEH
ncbi:hypothetical protein CEW46_21160 [Bacillus cereus]|nr:hypothetical protein CEW46_21160 [Bacillus cereus]